jgi:hypothetical protein
MPAFTDEEWAEVLENEVPALDHPVVKQFLQGRQNLINEEDKERSGKFSASISKGTRL